MRWYTVVLGLACLAPLGWSAPARADEPSLADKASARDLFTEAMTLRSKGDVEQALAKFKAAYALWPSPSTGLELGRTHMMLGQLIEARERFLETAKLPPKPTETPAAQEAREEARKLADTLQPKIASLTFKVTGAPPGSSVRITLDGRELPNETLATARKVNPGKHVAIGRAPGAADVTVEVELGEGEVREVPLVFGAPVAPPPPPSDAKKGDAKARGTSSLTYVGFGLAGVGLVVGGVTGVLAVSKASSLRDACDGERCPPSAHGDVDSYQRMGTISTISFAVAGVGAAVGLYGLLSSPSKEPSSHARITPWIGLGSAGVGGAF